MRKGYNVTLQPTLAFDNEGGAELNGFDIVAEDNGERAYFPVYFDDIIRSIEHHRTEYQLPEVDKKALRAFLVSSLQKVIDFSQAEQVRYDDTHAV